MPLPQRLAMGIYRGGAEISNTIRKLYHAALISVLGKAVFSDGRRANRAAVNGGRNPFGLGTEGGSSI